MNNKASGSRRVMNAWLKQQVTSLKGWTVKFNPQLNGWAVTFNGNLFSVCTTQAKAEESVFYYSLVGGAA